jgi:hypothetical protein
MAAQAEDLYADLGVNPDSAIVPPKVKRNIGRGRAAMLKGANQRRLCERFEDGDSYHYLNARGQLNFQNTAPGFTDSGAPGKPGHRVRNAFNIIKPLIQGKVSKASQRTPSYQVLPSTTDQNRVSAAELAEKAARYGYGQWGIGPGRRHAALKAIGHGGEAFAMPYFDPNVGPYTALTNPDTGVVEQIGQGEIKLLVLGGNEVYWQPGCAFKESPWWVIERAVTAEEIQDLPGYLEGDLNADADTSDIPSGEPAEGMVMKTEYFERPCPKYPEGRYFCIANNRLVVEPSTYPLTGADNRVIDEPVLHRLAWDAGDGSKRRYGLTWQLVDSQRTVQDCLNKIIEWKNRALLPQMLARINSMKTRRTDEPGAVLYWEGAPEDKPQWENVPEIPGSLFRVIDTVMQIMRLIASDDQSEAQADLTNVAAKTLQQVIEESLNRWDDFRQEMAEWDAAIMRHSLLLCARHYSEPRLMKIKGRDGWERVPDFLGADLMGEVDVRVFPDSLIPQTRQGVQDQLTWINANFPGWLQPQDALAAIQEGSVDRLTESYWLDVARANDVIQRLRDGTFMDMPSRSNVDPLTQQPITDPQTGESMGVPGYMPDQQDNLAIWKKVFADWMKTDDYSRQDPPVQEAARQVWQAIQALEQAKAVKDAQTQMQIAAGQGMANAAGPQTKGMPSLPGSGQPPGPQ